MNLLLNMSKVFERLIYKQIENFMSKKVSPKFCCFRKNCNTQYSLISMLEKCKSKLDEGKHVGGFLMDFSKAFGKVNHDLLIAKLQA